MTINREGLFLIKMYEGFKSKPYLCPANVWTIGYGTTTYPNGNPVLAEDPEITDAQAEIYLREYVSKITNEFNNFIKENNITLNRDQFSALISFFYNCGTGVLYRETGIRNGLLLEDFDMVSNFMAKYIKATVRGEKVIIPGLVRRRESEIKLFRGSMSLPQIS